MKVFRVVINKDQETCGIVFDESVDGLNQAGRSGRGLITLPENIRVAVLAAAQAELDKIVAEEGKADPDANWSTELHRIHALRQSRSERAKLEAERERLESDIRNRQQEKAALDAELETKRAKRGEE
jgi:hypothetical protein